MTITANYEILFRTVQLLRSNVESKQNKAFELFSKATADIRNSVYEIVSQQMTFAHSYWGCGEHAFHDQNGLSSTPEQKAQAIEAKLSQMVAAMKLKGAPNLKEVYDFLSHIADLIVACPEEGMRLFDKLSPDVRADVYKELCGMLPLDQAADAFHNRNGLTSLPSLKALAIECCLLRNVGDLFQTDNALAIDLFKRIRPIHQSHIQGDPSREAIDRYLEQFQKHKRSRILEWCEVKLGVVPHQTPGGKEAKETAAATELLQKLIRTEPAMTVRTVAENQFGLGQMFEEWPFQSLGDRSFTDRFCNVDGAKLWIFNQFYFPITWGTQHFSQQRLVSCGCAEDRELLFLNPDNCPELDLHYNQFRRALSAGMTTTGEVLSKLKEYMRSKMFTDKKPQIEAVRAFNATISAISARSTRHKDHLDWKIPMISIDEYVRQGIGVDRHHALVDCYFIDRLLCEENPLLKGTVQFMKFNLKDDDAGAQVFTTFIPERQMGDPEQRAWKQRQEAPAEKWLLDSFRDVLINFAHPQERIEFRSRYAIPLDDVVLKSAPAAEKNGQPRS